MQDFYKRAAFLGPMGTGLVLIGLWCAAAHPVYERVIGVVVIVIGVLMIGRAFSHYHVDLDTRTARAVARAWNRLITAPRLIRLPGLRRKGIRIDWAFYTPHDEDNHLNGVNVAPAVQAALDRGATSLVADNTTLVGGDDNDPYLRTYKHLQIQWRIHNRVRSTRVPEGSEIDLLTGKVTAPDTATS